ncbi:hypothetical protein J6590_005875 [Homalodisca vitripennis]|nr:hypothetical protein J6590_089325 [Homalodisca vitripennis]KAG8328134.1 hypothetical protein J6590_000790 [Homalodisca vitripennis]KAG8338330.1 hypothetical protein J6590_005875 [Homalodisca vitripennis]
MRHSSSTEQRLAESRAVWMSVCLFGKQQTLVLVVSRSVSVFCTHQSGRIFGKRQTLLHPHIRLCGWEIRTVHGFQFCHQSLIDYWVAPPPNEEQFQAERNIDLPNLSDNVPSASREEPEQRNEAIVLPACATTSPNYASSSFKPPPRKKSRTAEEIEIKKKMDAAFTTLQSLQPKKEKHLCDIYGELVAAKLKSMDESTREICMHRIDNVLFEMRMVKGPATSGNTYFMQPSPSSSASVNSSPCPDETLTLYTVPSDSNELHALSGTVVVCSDAENSEHPPNVGLENYFSKFK